MTSGGKRTYLAFDLGASNWRAALGSEDGSGLRVREVHRESHAPSETDGGIFWNIDGIYQGMKRILKHIADSGVQPSAIGIDSWAVDYGLLDAEGVLIETPRCYRDSRNTGMLDRLLTRIDLQTLFQRTGVAADDMSTLCQLLAAIEDDPQILQKACRLLFIPDLLRYWLCGGCATDLTLASVSQLYNVSTRRWDTDLIAELGLRGDILPSIRPAGTVVGRLLPELQRETGLGPVPIVTGASHDTAAAFSAVDCEDDCAILSSGTWSILGLNVERPVFTDSIDPKRFGYEGNPDGTFRLAYNVPGMWLLEQCRAAWAREGIRTTYAGLIGEARSSLAFGSEVDPFWPGLHKAANMPEAIAVYCRQTGQAAPRSPGEFALSVFRGLARAYSLGLRELSSIADKRLRKLIVIGGGSRNTLLNDLTAETAEVAVVAGPVEATTLGNMLNQRLALDHR